MFSRLSFDPRSLRDRAERSARGISDLAARVQVKLEHGRTLKLVRLGGDVAVALGSMLLQHGRLQDGTTSLLHTARTGFASGAIGSVALAALLNLHKQARGEQNWPQTLKATSREAFSGAGSGMAATLAASTSKIALGAVSAPFVAKAAAPIVAAAVAGWLAQEAAERSMQAAGDWLFVPSHAMPEQPSRDSD